MEEEKPLLKEHPSERRATGKGLRRWFEKAQAREGLASSRGRKLGDKGRSTSYRPESILTWRVFTNLEGTILQAPRVRYMLGVVVSVALATATVVFYVVPNPENLSTSAFFSIVLYFKVFIAFMLGLYMSNCLARWWKSVVAVTDYLMCVRKLVWLCNANGVPHLKRNAIQRLGILAVCLLEAEVSGFWVRDEAVLAERWLALKHYCLTSNFASSDEMAMLETVESDGRSMVAWSWIGSLLRLDVAPPVSTLFQRAATDAITQIKMIKSFVRWQLPLMYSHILAILVHLNNIIMAVASGVSMAGMMGNALRALGYGGGARSWTAFYASSQAIAMALLALVVQPLVYIAFLEISAHLCDPFTDPKYGVPLLDMLDQLISQLHDLNELADPQTLEEAPFVTRSGSAPKQRPSTSAAVREVSEPAKSPRKTPRSEGLSTPRRTPRESPR